MSRISTVTRLQFVNRWTFVWIPLIILAGSLALSLIVFALIPVTGPKYSGAAQAPLWYFLSAGIMAMSSTFPFAQAMSITRREFYLGTLIAAAITSAGLAVLFMLGGLLEAATGGYGLNGYHFRLDWLWTAGPVVAGLFYFATAMLFFCIGFFFSAVYRRWGAPALTIGLVTLGLVIVVTGTLINRSAFGAWILDAFMTSGVAGAVALMLTLAVAAGGAAYLPLRRSTP